MRLNLSFSSALAFASAVSLCAAETAPASSRNGVLPAQGSAVISSGELGPLGDQVYFGVTGRGTGQLWKSDGTVAGTGAVRSFEFSYSSPGAFARLGSTLFFFVDSALWSVDSSGSVSRVASLSTEAQPWIAAVTSSLFFFDLPDGQRSSILWRSDGTPEGTLSLSDLAPGLADSVPGLLTPVGDVLFFFATDASGPSLWRSDGSPSGTQRLRALPELAYGNGLAAALGETLIFVVEDESDPNLPFQLWRSDGTPDGTVPLRRFAGGPEQCGPYLCFRFGPTNLISFGDSVLFVAEDGVHGQELWKTDGTADGTVLVKDVFPGPDSGLPNESLVRAGDLVFFQATDPDHGTELWKSDGSEAGTALVEDLVPGPDSSLAYPAAALGGRLLFVSDVRGELFSTDGTAQGTQSILHFSPGGTSLGGFASPDGGIAFFVNRSDGGTLWRTDGTESGTTRVPLEGGRPRPEIVPVAAPSRATRSVLPRR